MRKCFFPDEGNLNRFAYYTQSNCKLECAWKKAEEICGCTPWYIPAVDDSQMCFILGNLCFDQIIRNVEQGEIVLNCSCEKDCIRQRYTMSLRDKVVLERSQPEVYTEPSEFPSDLLSMSISFDTDTIDGNEVELTSWYNLGEK